MRLSHRRSVATVVCVVAVVSFGRSVPSRAELPPRPDNPFQYGDYLMELIARAEEAERGDRCDEAIEIYEILAKEAPERAVSYRRMCNCYDILGDRENAIRTCRDALGSEGVEVRDYVQFVRVIRRSDGPLTEQEIEDANAAIAHLKSEAPQPAAADRLDCEMAVALDDEARLARCSAALTELAPNDPATLTYRWSLATLRSDQAAVAAVIERAREVGMPKEAIARMEDESRAHAAGLSSSRSYSNLPILTWRLSLVAGLVLFIVGAILLWRRAGARSV